MSDRPRRSAAGPKRFSPTPATQKPTRSRKSNAATDNVQEPDEELIEESSSVKVEIKEEILDEQIQTFEYSVPDILLKRAATSRVKHINTSHAKREIEPEQEEEDDDSFLDDELLKELGIDTDNRKKIVLPMPKKKKPLVKTPTTSSAKNQSPGKRKSARLSGLETQPVPGQEEILEELTPSASLSDDNNQNNNLLKDRNKSVEKDRNKNMIKEKQRIKEESKDKSTRSIRIEVDEQQLKSTTCLDSERSRKRVNEQYEDKEAPPPRSKVPKYTPSPSLLAEKTASKPESQKTVKKPPDNNPNHSSHVKKSKDVSSKQSLMTTRLIEIPKQSPIVTKFSSDANSKQQLSSKKSIDSSSKQPLTKKKSIDLSKPVAQPSSSNLLDDILGVQDKMFKDQNKTQQEMDEERHKLELKRRRISSENPYDKAAMLTRRDIKPHQSTSINLSKQSTSAPFKKPSLGAKKSLDTPKPVVQPSSLDLLGDILGDQDKLLKDRNKSGQEKEEELRRLEMERRRVSADNPYEKAAKVSAGSIQLVSNNKPNVPFKKLSLTIDKSPGLIPKSSPLTTEKPADSTNSTKQPSPLISEKPSDSRTQQQPSPLFIEKPLDSTEPQSKQKEEFPLVIEKPLDSTVQQQPSPLVVEKPLDSTEPQLKHKEASTSDDSTLLDDILNNLDTLEKEDLEDEEIEEYQPMEIDEPLECSMIEEETAIISKSINNANLVAEANLILETIQHSTGNDGAVSANVTYEQVQLSDAESNESIKVDPEEKVEMDFYGEPVPDDDENDDLFENAAGIPKSKKIEQKKIEEEPLPDNEIIELDYYNADINIKSDPKNKWLIDPENGDGFALMWGCVRSNYGLRLPKNPGARSQLPPIIMYQVQIKEYLSTKHLPFEESDAYEVRVGWSSESVNSIVGESAYSYAFCSTGRKASNNVFSDFGRSIGIGEIITVLLDLVNNEMRILVNNDDLGIVCADLQFFARDSSDDCAIIFPHIGIKNVKALVNFGVELPESECASWSIPVFLNEKEYKYFGNLNRFSNIIVATRRPPPSKADCTVIFMVGLPAAGKTRWVQSYLTEHADERWIVVNAELMLEFMKVNGHSRKRVHQGRWDAVMGLAAKASLRSLQLMCRRRHNYIIDQTNLSREKRKQKLALFQDFVRKCVVLIPSAEDYEHRQTRQARDDRNSEQVTPEALLHLKAMFTLPETDQEPVEEVVFIEPPPERIGEAIESVRRFNDEGRPYLPVPHNPRRR